jgi:uncharacterized protein (DUF2147 family)
VNQTQIQQLLAKAKGIPMNMQNRTEWEFDYTASSLAAAATAQRDHRLSRVKAWEEKKGEVMAKIKDTGLTVHESVAEQFGNSYQNATQANFGAQVMVDNTLQRDLNECVGKINQHRASAKEYDGWIQVLEGNPDSRLKLKHDDWMFFFGKR